MWEKNLDALLLYNPSLALKLKNEYGQVSCQHVKEMVTKDENKALVITLGEKEYVMNSRFRPVQEAANYASQFDDLKEHSVSVFFGFGNGIFANEIVKKGTEQTYFVFYEPDPDSFLFALRHYDLTSLFQMPNVKIFVETLNESEVAVSLPAWVSWQNLPLTEIYPLPKYMDMYPDSYKTFLKLVRDVVVRAHLSINTMKRFAKRFLENSVQMLQYIPDSTSAAAFTDVFPKDMPAILISAGPSLAKNIEVLKRAKNHAFLLCVDTAMTNMLRAGIVPDAVVCVDPNKGIGKHEEFEKEYREIMWIRETSSNARQVARFQGVRNVFAAGTDVYGEALFAKYQIPLPILATGGSVANTGFSLLEYWGFKTVIMVGQDLALTGNHRHAGDSIDACQQALDNGFALYDIEGYYGDTVKTRDDYLTYLKWFEGALEVSEFEHVINATEGGAMIHGMENMSLEEALNQYATTEYDIKQILDGVPGSFTEEEQRELRETLSNLPSRAGFFARKFKEGKSLSERSKNLLLRPHYDEREFQKLQKKLTDIDKAVSNEDEFILISNRACEVDQRISREMVINDDSMTSEIGVLDSMIELYQAFYEAALELKEQAETMVSSMKEKESTLPQCK